MAIHLLDVNVLVALAWREHILHEPAQRWFGERADGWATAAVTEAGFLRVSINARVTDRAVPFSVALDLLVELREVAGHERWADDVDMATSGVARRAPVMGSQQVTDVHLAALAAGRGGRLATLDRGVAEALHPDDRGLVSLIPVER